MGVWVCVCVCRGGGEEVGDQALMLEKGEEERGKAGLVGRPSSLCPPGLGWGLSPAGSLRRVTFGLFFHSHCTGWHVRQPCDVPGNRHVHLSEGGEWPLPSPLAQRLHPVEGGQAVSRIRA